MNKIDKSYREGFIEELIKNIPYFSNKFITMINEILVAEMWTRYNNLQDKRIRYPKQFTEKDTKKLDEVKTFVREENRKKVEPGSLEDRINKFLDENLPL